MSEPADEPKAGQPVRDPEPRPRVLTDRGAVALAAATWLGALAAMPLPLWCGLAVAAVALVLRRPTLVVFAAFACAGSLAAGAWAGLAPPPSAQVQVEARVVRDAEPIPRGVRVEVVIADRHVDLVAFGSTAGRLRALSTGEIVTVSGRLTPVPERARWWAATRHVSGRLAVTEVGTVRPGAAWWRLADGFRSHLIGSAGSMSREHQSLFSGLLLGDDRAQSEELEIAFERAGLTHLLAVSGSNVAFVLTAAAPLLGRLGARSRVVTTAVVLVFFASVTRFEPSVLRAVAMAALASTATSLGRPVSSLRVLAIATTLVVLVDPMLVWRTGFQLSVLATLGIITLAGPLSETIALPRWLALPLSVTLGAQIMTGPLLAWRFDSVPVAALPANLLAQPAAGFAMIYGIVAGIIAGFLPSSWAALVHRPTEAVLWWLATVARRSADLPLGSIGPFGSMALCLGTACFVRWSPRKDVDDRRAPRRQR